MNLPNFMCIGAAKSGTTTLYDIIKQHPDVYVSPYKEPHFFDNINLFENGIDWYNKTFFSDVKNEKCIFDFTPSYLFNENAPKRIFNLLGKKMKFIIILRNPVDRAYSHYLHSVRDENEDLSFQTAINEEKKRILSYRKENKYHKELKASYISQGMYGKMVKNYLNFFPKNNFLFIHFEEDLVTERSATIKKVLDFLSLDNSKSLNIDIKSNSASKVRYKWIMRLLKSSGWWRKLIKKLIFSYKWRQIIKDKLHRINIISFTPEPLSKKIKNKVYQVFFLNDIKKLEGIIDRKMNW